MKKGRSTGPFRVVLLLPVGLADFMETDAKRLFPVRQPGIWAHARLKSLDKPVLLVKIQTADPAPHRLLCCGATAAQSPRTHRAQSCTGAAGQSLYLCRRAWAAKMIHAPFG